jgi:hypothetical protein
MSDDPKTPENDSVITKVEAELARPGDISMEHLTALEKRLSDRLDMLTKDRTADDQEKGELRATIEGLQEDLKKLRETAEEHDKKRNDSSTIVIPPAELDPPTHQNPAPDSTPENASPSQQNKKQRMRWW